VVLSISAVVVAVCVLFNMSIVVDQSIAVTSLVSEGNVIVVAMLLEVILPLGVDSYVLDVTYGVVKLFVALATVIADDI